MIESTLTAKGQTTVPAEIRTQLHAAAGARLVWHVSPGGLVNVRVKTKSLLDLEGSLKPKNGKRVAIKDMNAWR